MTEKFEGTCPSCGQEDMTNQTALATSQTALIYDSETREFGIIMPSVSDDTDMSPQQIVLVACLMRLNEDEAWVNEMFDYAKDKFEAHSKIILPN
jgi:hypothetical protein